MEYFVRPRLSHRRKIGIADIKKPSRIVLGFSSRQLINRHCSQQGAYRHRRCCHYWCRHCRHHYRRHWDFRRHRRQNQPGVLAADVAFAWEDDPPALPADASQASGLRGEDRYCFSAPDSDQDDAPARRNVGAFPGDYRIADPTPTNGYPAPYGFRVRSTRPTAHRCDPVLGWHSARGYGDADH